MLRMLLPSITCSLSYHARICFQYTDGLGAELVVQVVQAVEEERVEAVVKQQEEEDE